MQSKNKSIWTDGLIKSFWWEWSLYMMNGCNLGIYSQILVSKHKSQLYPLVLAELIRINKHYCKHYWPSVNKFESCEHCSLISVNKSLIKCSLYKVLVFLLKSLQLFFDAFAWTYFLFVLVQIICVSVAKFNGHGMTRTWVFLYCGVLIMILVHAKNTFYI